MQNTATRRLSRMFQLIAFSMKEEKDRLSDLDGAIGDADHGITMVLGFSAVNNALAKVDLEQTLPSEIFATAAAAFLDAVGASTGPLYATAFRYASKALKPRESLDTEGQAIIIEAITRGIQDRGKGQRGDKTMLDAWVPAMETAVDAQIHGLSGFEMWNRILEAAAKGADSTRSMVAARGRAARLGERSLGHIDPGAASAVIILRAMRDSFDETN
ncbi:MULTISPECIES: dihydroxyacetone kinase subunit DhaL [Brucella/Ochrobactrum group]|uniref:Dihydroxyacetone kinase subunit DhaL n=1 Tax=Brucella pseudintermedia TaxID=370111 RepID=A0ABY5UI34_9HYPH|nr:MULTISPECIES: dihydroxyacetone kinase subunit DhaL [Brucella/Ochrobactrum group]KAB2683375.1 dihydroxyacetone kinase subunit L [Brucella pseudintermedia]MCO7728226.1 dihydroxyacetone kinase subunit DhaL [Brucella intermedia]NKE74138.1 dihydroxyacetone kinase subunit L [Ochrobactrum sp. MC-1LL]TWH03502.1 dihydroxyacetone kinase-like protein [Ochrobactrum sp. J50]UWL62974.1 dihydroxyacetone kinase subunit DhaL [Brucella pseudintermedia]